MNAEDYMRQAWMTANMYLIHGRTRIDEEFGDGYAAKHPELLGHFMVAAALDFQACFSRGYPSSDIERVCDAIDQATSRLSREIENLTEALIER